MINPRNMCENMDNSKRGYIKQIPGCSSAYLFNASYIRT